MNKIMPFKEDKYHRDMFNWGTKNHFTMNENGILYFYDSFTNVLYRKMIEIGRASCRERV